MMYKNYDEFEKAKLQCRDCIVGRVFNHVVPSDGNKVDPLILIIGEAAGREEIERNKPFIGKCGKFLRKTLQEFGITPSNSLITNTLPCRPPNNIFPKNKDLVYNCVSKWVREEIKLLHPKYILSLGANSNKFVWGFNFYKFSDIRGQMINMAFSLLDNGYLSIKFDSFDGDAVFSVMPTFHPSYVLRKKYSKTDDIADRFKNDIKILAKKAGL